MSRGAEGIPRGKLAVNQLLKRDRYQGNKAWVIQIKKVESVGLLIASQLYCMIMICKNSFLEWLINDGSEGIKKQPGTKDRKTHMRGDRTMTMRGQGNWPYGSDPLNYNQQKHQVETEPTTRES